MTTKNTKILAMDLDGTAIQDNGFFGSRTLRALKAAQDYGYYICFVSGRREVDMYKIKDYVHYSDFQILNTGGKIINSKTKEVILNHCPSYNNYKKLVDFCINHQCTLHIISGMNWFTNKMEERMITYTNHLGLSPTIYSTFEEVSHLCAEGFVVYSDGPKVVDFLEKNELGLYGIESEPMCFDIQDVNATKWNGLLYLSKMLEVDPKDIISIGNFTNDIDMISNSGLGVAVQNAIDTVKSIAGYVTRTDNNQDAIAEVVEKFILNQSLEGAGYE